MRQMRGSLLLAIFAVACGGTHGSTSSCSGCNPQEVRYPNPPYPGGGIQNQVIHARVTQNALDFLSKHLADLINGALPVENGRVVFDLDEALLDPQNPIQLRDGCLGEPDSVPCATPVARSSVSIPVETLAQKLKLQWLPPDASQQGGVHIALSDLDISLDIVTAINVKGVLPAASCRLRDKNGAAAVHISGLGFDVRLRVDDSGPTPKLSSRVENVVVDLGGSSDDLISGLLVTPCDGSNVDPSCHDPLCDSVDANCQDVCGLVDLFGELGGFLSSVMQPILNSLAPSLAHNVSDAMLSSLGNLPLELQTELDVGKLLGGPFADFAPLKIKGSANGNIGVGGIGPGAGLDVHLNAGITAQPSECVLGAVAPDFAASRGPAPDYSGFIEVQDPDGSTHFERYHFVASISQAVLDQAAWNVYQAGFTCFRLDAFDIQRLAGDSFKFNAGMLMNFDARLLGITDPDAPLLLSVRAAAPPRVRLGDARRIADGVYEPLLELSFENLELGLYMFIDGAQLQVSALKADMTVKLGVERLPGHALALVIQNVGVDRVEEDYNELAPNANLSALLEVVLDLAVSQALGPDARFNLDLANVLSGALGTDLELRLNALRRDVGPSHIPHLSAYLTLCDAQQIADPTNSVCYRDPTSITAVSTTRNVTRDVHVTVDEASLYVAADPERFPPERWLSAPSGAARLNVSELVPTHHLANGTAANPAFVEYQYRVDDSAWSTFQAAQLIDAQSTLWINSPRLRLVGSHSITVRSRLIGRYMTLSEPVAVSFWVDRERPSLQLGTVTNEGVQLVARDLGTPHPKLFARTRAPDKQPSEWQEISPWVDTTTLGAGELEVFAVDAAGNSSDTLYVPLVPKDETANPTVTTATASESAPEASGGCSSTAAAHRLIIALVGLLGLFSLRRRRNGGSRW